MVFEQWGSLISWAQVGVEEMPGPVWERLPRIYAMTQKRESVCDGGNGYD
jgi:effector-binding domain-containing protein